MSTTMTLDELKTFVKGYVDASKSAGTWTTDPMNSFTHMVEKIGKQINIQGAFNDKLYGLFDGDALASGKIIEEYFINLPMPVAFDDGVTEEKSWTDYRPTFADAAYSYSIGRQKIPFVMGYDTVESSALNASETASITANCYKAFQDSYTNTVYSVKEQAVGNMASKAIAATTTTLKLSEGLAKPVDTATGEAFILKIKELVEDASDRSENNCLSGKLIGAAPSLVLLVNKKVLPNIEVKTLAGAIHDEKLALNLEVRVVDSFGTDMDEKKVYAVLLDPRGVKVHPSYNAVRSDANANKDAVRTIRHFELTPFISKYTYIHVLYEA